MVIIIQRAEILQLLRISKDISNHANEVFQDDFDNMDRMYESVDKIADIILDMLLIPRDTSVDYDHNDDKFYSRDFYYQVIYDYTLGYTDYSAEEVLDMLLALKEGDNY